MSLHETYIQRCFDLAQLGAGNVAPNPMVGAVLVYNDRIISEGWHQQYGQAHAEVNCINAVESLDLELIKRSTMYVSLEPCAHFGKTPPCADLIIERQIPTVIVACKDSYDEVDGKGIQKLRSAGIEVITPLLEKDALELNKRFFLFHSRQRPFIILKWAQTANGKIGNTDAARLMISNEVTNREVHKWRSEEASILVGTNTALKDDPSLTVRHWSGSNPVRLVIDKELKLPRTLHLLDGVVKTIVFNSSLDETIGETIYYKIRQEGSFLAEVMKALYLLKIQSVLVEGGSSLLQSFINEGLWDEARVITNTSLEITWGISAPVLVNASEISTTRILFDTIRIYKPFKPSS
ncbi:MAG: bifunctional diaminohydroxyphosphoribosylaminopyrimidine deaminase/5-amino-6-(5-phosphoribosylamino)uracil reductase RibD [Ferruginibacter sp.]